MTALVVDDEPLVLMLSADMLRDLGFEVLEAGTGAAALQILEARPDVAMLLTDVRMPVMDGVELASCARRRHPHMKVIFASGYPGAQAPTCKPMLEKPFNGEALSRLVERELRP